VTWVFEVNRRLDHAGLAITPALSRQISPVPVTLTAPKKNKARTQNKNKSENRS
jgi:hypothetical protein